MRTSNHEMTRDIKVHFERISQLFRSGLPVRTGTVGAPTRRARGRWPDCPCVRGRLAKATAGTGADPGLPVRTGTVGGTRTAWPASKSDCPCVRGRLATAARCAHHAQGLPVRTGTVGTSRPAPSVRLGIARAYGDGWCTTARALCVPLGLPVRTGTVGRVAVTCPCVRGRLAVRPSARSAWIGIARAYGDGWNSRLSLSARAVACPCVRGTVGSRPSLPCDGRLSPRGRFRLARAYGDGWHLRSPSRTNGLRGRLDIHHGSIRLLRGLPVRTGTVGRVLRLTTCIIHELITP